MTTKTLQQMTWPLVISFTLRFLFSLVDLAYAAALEDDNAAVAAIGFYLPFQAFYIAIWVGLSAGFTAALANAFGRCDEQRVGALQRAMLRILVLLIPPLLLYAGAIWLLAPHLGLESRATSAFRVYATTLTLGLPLTGFWSVYPDSIVKAHHDTRSTMVAGLASTFANVALNTLFVFGFGLGILGIALATVLSRLAGLSYALRRARALEAERRRDPWPTTTQAWPAPAATILRLAVPGAATHLLTAAEGAVVNKVLTGLPDSTSAIASWGVYHQLLSLSLMPAVGASVAVVPFVARLLPQGRAAEIRRDLRQTLRISAILALVITVGVGWLAAAPVASFLVAPQRDGGTSMAIGALRLLPLGALAALPFLILRPVFESAQRPRLGLLVALARFVLLGPPLVVAGAALAPGWSGSGLHGVVAGTIVAATIASILAACSARTTLLSAQRN
jgi:Na+-driven multidrug efflux pump